MKRALYRSRRMAMLYKMGIDNAGIPVRKRIKPRIIAKTDPAPPMPDPRCHRCGSRCDAYEHQGQSDGETLSFCTFVCARQWHYVTGREVIRAANHTVAIHATMPLIDLELTLQAVSAITSKQEPVDETGKLYNAALWRK